jgi:transketolase
VGNQPAVNTRIAFINELIRIAGTDESIIVLDPDVGEATHAWDFRHAYPKRFYEMGIAEQNTFGVAAGLASTGLRPFVFAFAVFASMRAAEMIRTNICYPRRNVKIIGGYAGLSNGKDGATHQSIEDLAIMRSFPNLAVMAVSDIVTARKAAALACCHVGPMYIRMEYELASELHNPEMYLEVGRAYVVRAGKDVTILSSGTALSRTVSAAKKLSAQGVDCELIDVVSSKPFDGDTVLASIRKTGAVVTLEDHNACGGLGSVVAELLLEAQMCPKFRQLAVNDTFTESGTTAGLRKKFHLDEGAIVDAVQAVLA